MPSTASVLQALVRSAHGGSGAVDLAALLRDTVAAGVPREALVLRLSGLAPAQRRGQHRRLLEEAWQPLRRSARVRVFDLPNGDLVAIEPPTAHHLQAVEATLRRLLDGEEAADPRRPVIEPLRLPAEAASLMALVETALGMAERTMPVRPVMPARRGLRADTLPGAERAVASADLAAMVRRSWVCRLDPGGGAPEPRFEERRIDIAALHATILPDEDPGRAPWLRRRLRHAIDTRLLGGLARPEELRDLRDCCLPLTMDSVATPAFRRFDANLPAALRGRLAIAFTAEEVLADPAGFLFTRAYLHGRGYLIALEAETAGILAILRVQAGGFDRLRLRWDPGLPALGSEAARVLLDRMPGDPDRVWLVGADRPAAIAWGWEMGLRLFAGRLIEQRRPAG